MKNLESKTTMELLTLANVEVRKVQQYINDNANAFLPMDLKLHGLYNFDMVEILEDCPLLSEECRGNVDNLFYEFCNLSYDCFVDSLTFNYTVDFKDLVRYIGQSSQFLLHKGNYVVEDYRDSSKALLNAYDFINDEVISIPELKEDNEGNLILDNTWEYYDEEDAREELQEVIETLYDTFVKHYEDTVIAYERIREFKENATEEFRLYAEDLERDLQYQE